MTEQQQGIAVEELLAVLVLSQDGTVEIPFEFFDPQRIAGMLIAVDHDPENKKVLLSLVKSEDVDLEEDNTNE